MKPYTRYIQKQRTYVGIKWIGFVLYESLRRLDVKLLTNSPYPHFTAPHFRNFAHRVSFEFREEYCCYEVGPHTFSLSVA
jgi:hypothetical protein